MTALLLEITVSDHGHYRTVDPRIVLEVAFDAVQAVGAASLRASRCAFRASRGGGTTSRPRRSTRCRACGTWRTAVERERVQLVDPATPRDAVSRAR